MKDSPYPQSASLHVKGVLHGLGISESTYRRYRECGRKAVEIGMEWVRGSIKKSYYDDNLY